MKIAVYIFVSILLMTSSCKECSDSVTRSISEKQRNFSDIKPGSYWIMRDSISGQIDSFVAGWIGESGQEKYTSKHCYDTWVYRSIRLDEYDAATKQKIDTLTWVMQFGPTEYQIVEMSYRYPYKYCPLPFSLNLDQKNVLINSRVYDNVSAYTIGYDSYKGAICLDAEHLLLKMSVRLDTIYNKVWELERANIIR